MIDLRIAIPAAVAWGGALVLLGFPAAMGAISVSAWGLAAVFLLVALMRRGSTAVLVAVSLAAFALVATSMLAQNGARRPAELLDSARGSHDYVVVTTQTVTPATKHFTATLVRASSGGVSVPVVVFGAAPRSRVEIGSTLALMATLQPTDPGEEASALLFAREPARMTSDAPWYLSWANSLRTGLAREATALPGDGGALLPGLALGDVVAIAPDLSGDLKAASLTHLTAVSGANCAVIIGLVMLLGGVLSLPRVIRVVASGITLGAFVVLVTPQPSVLRAAVMCAVMLVALAAGRPARGVPLVAVTVLGLLTIDPWLARNYGFALSVLATVGLMTLSAPLSRVLGRWMPVWLATVISVPIAAQLACGPVLVLLSPTVPVYGIVANLLAEPAAPVATILGLIACVLLAVFPPLGSVITAVAWVPAAWIAAVAHFCARLPGAQLPWLSGVAGALLLVFVTVAALIAALGTGFSRRTRRAIAFALVLTLALMAVGAEATRVSEQLGRPADWQIADCDIGQGDAMVVRAGDSVALMDTGPSEALLSHCLESLGVTHIDLLVLSHFDLDHVAGTPAVDGMVDRVLVGPSSGQRRDREIIQGLLDGGARVDRVSEGVTGRLGSLDWSILWPPSPLPSGVLPGNAASVTVLFEPGRSCADGCLSSLFTGDLGEDAQARMLRANPGLPSVDVVEVAHHGSADQSADLYARLRAAVGLIGVGVDNRYGHPTSRLLGILRDTGTLAARTDRQGLILVSSGTRAGQVSVWSQHEGDGGGD